MSPEPSKSRRKRAATDENSTQSSSDLDTRGLDASEGAVESIQALIRKALPHLHSFSKNPDETHQALTELEGEVSTIPLHVRDPATLAANVELRRALALALAWPEMERAESYTLADFEGVIQKYGGTLRGLCRFPALMTAIGPAIFGPTLYPITQEDLSSQQLERAVCELRRSTGDLSGNPTIFDRWQEMAMSSLVSRYNDMQSLLSPQEYSKAIQLQFHSVKLGPHLHEKAGEVLREALYSPTGRPRVLFEMLEPASRKIVAKQLDSEGVVRWVGGQLECATHALKQAQQPSGHFKADHLSADIWNNSNRFSIPLKAICEALRFFNLYSESVLDTSSADASSIPADSRRTRFHASRAHGIMTSPHALNVALGSVSAELMRELARCLTERDPQFKFERDLAFSLEEFFAISGVLPDAHEAQSVTGVRAPVFSYHRDLLPALNQAMLAGDFEIAGRMRLLFPISNTGYVKRDLVDEHIEEHQAFIIEGLAVQAQALRTKLVALAMKAENRFSPHIKGELQIFREGIRTFLRADLLPDDHTIEPGHTLVKGISPLIGVLLGWDGLLIKQQEKGFPNRDEPHLFEGCNHAAILLELLCSSATSSASSQGGTTRLQKAIVNSALTLNGVGNESLRKERLLAHYGLLCFVKVTDQELLSAISAFPQESDSPLDFSYEYRRAKRARLLYALAVPPEERMIPARVDYKHPELVNGQAVAEAAEKRASQHEDRFIPSALKRLADWLDGRFAQGRRDPALVHLCSEVVSSGVEGGSSESEKLVDRALQVVMSERMRDMTERVSESDVQWITTHILNRFLAPYQPWQHTSRVMMAKLLALVLKSEHRANICTNSKISSELVRTLDHFVSRSPGNMADGIAAWQHLLRVPAVASWQKAMRVHSSR